MVERQQGIDMESPQAFDMGFFSHVASAEVQEKGGEIRRLMAGAGYDLGILPRGTVVTQARSRLRKDQLHDMAGALYLHWAQMRTDGDHTAAEASAKWFNKVTFTAREGFRPPEKIVDLRDAVIASMRYSPGSSEPIAKALQTTAQELTPDQIWPGVMLPTHPEEGQYGRVRRDVSRIPGVDAKIVITQPTIISDGMSPHSHLDNWGYSAPLGKPQINRSWQQQTKSIASEILPLEPVREEAEREVVYRAGDVVVIPPKAIHSIEAVPEALPGMHLREFARHSSAVRKELIESTRFEELSNLHVYVPDLRLRGAAGSTRDFLDRLPLEEFSRKYDMVVFDQEAQTIWAGDGGAWRRKRQAVDEEGRTWVEGDNRSKSLDPVIVRRHLLTVPSPRIQVYGREHPMAA